MIVRPNDTDWDPEFQSVFISQCKKTPENIGQAYLKESLLLWRVVTTFPDRMDFPGAKILLQK